jgi:hypothetical protein
MNVVSVEDQRQHVRIGRPHVVLLGAGASLAALPDGDFGGFTIVKRSYPRFQDYAKFSAARSRYFDLTLPRRIAPADPKASSTMLGGTMWQFFGETHDAPGPPFRGVHRLLLRLRVHRDGA